MPGVGASKGAGDGSQKKPCKSGLLKMKQMGKSDRGGSLRWAVGVFGDHSTQESARYGKAGGKCRDQTKG